jgi:hypothetical protein
MYESAMPELSLGSVHALESSRFRSDCPYFEISTKQKLNEHFSRNLADKIGSGSQSILVQQSRFILTERERRVELLSGCLVRHVWTNPNLDSNMSDDTVQTLLLHGEPLEHIAK